MLVTLAALLVVSCAKATPTPTPRPTATPTATPMQVATPTPKPGGEEPSGKVIFANSVLDAMIGDPAQAPYRNWEQSGNLQITEYLFMHDQDSGNPMHPYLAEDWQVSSDGKKVTISVKKGIPWYTPPLPGAEGREKAILELLSNAWDKEPYWKLRYRGSCHDIFFLTTLSKVPEYITLMREIVDRYNYPFE